MASTSPSLSSSRSGSPISITRPNEVNQMQTTGIRITYELEETSVLIRPEDIRIRGLIDQELPPNSPSSTISSPSDGLPSNASSSSLNSPNSNKDSTDSPRIRNKNLTINFDQSKLSSLSLSPAVSMDEGIFFSSPLNSPARSTPSSPIGPKFKIIHEGDIHLCRLNHQRTVISKILSSTFLRRWETHRLYLNSVNITSKTPIGFMEIPIAYSNIEDVYSVSRWDSSQKFYIRIVIPDGSVLLQLSNKWVRDQWLNSINWKRNMLKFHRILTNPSIRPDTLIKELTNLIEMTLTTPLQDECIYQTSMDIVNEMLHIRLKEKQFDSSQTSIEAQINFKKLNEDIIMILSPLLEKTNPTTKICLFLSKHCRVYPRSMVIWEYYHEIVQRILKHNTDYGKYPFMRVLVQDFFMALNQHNDGTKLVTNFIKSVHGFGSNCPHPRVISNLVSVCLASIFDLCEHRQVDRDDQRPTSPFDDLDWSTHLNCFISIFQIISQFDDWRPLLAQILQPIPFPESTLAEPQFTKPFKSVVNNICMDSRCEVHQMLLSIREGKEGWLELYAPGNVACDDDGVFWSIMLENLIKCCCRRKRFYSSFLSIKSSLDSCMLRALRDDTVCQQILCDFLEMEMLLDCDNSRQQIVTTLQSTENGRQLYAKLCEQQMHLIKLQQTDGPNKLTLPSRSTDADLIKMLSSGSFGNLEHLSLAFTQVTSACAQHLIQLPSLRSLNLWSTQFSDSGLQIISEHLPCLQELNLCETPVTDKGIACLVSMTNLKRLNLNSTNLSGQTFEQLKQELPMLQYVDVCYTDAW